MAFDEGTGNRPPIQAPDFEANLEVYNSKVANIGMQIKAQQAILDQINSDIVAAQFRLRAIAVEKSDVLDQQIKVKGQTIQDLQNQHEEWLAKIASRQAEHDSISLDFSNKQKQLDNAWVDFQVQLGNYQVQFQQLNEDQSVLTKRQTQLDIDKKAFELYQSTQTSLLAKQTAEADRLTAVANEKLTEANNKMSAAIDLANTTSVARINLTNELNAAQPILAQADIISAQKAQNDIDAKNNSSIALQNQEDANQIKVARIAVNNQQQELNSRAETLSQAEAALKGGS